MELAGLEPASVSTLETASTRLVAFDFAFPTTHALFRIATTSGNNPWAYVEGS